MYKEVLSSIDGIEVYPIVALLIFFTFFVGLCAWFLLADKDRLQRCARLPLDDSPAGCAHPPEDHHDPH